MTNFSHPKLLQEIQKSCPELMEFRCDGCNRRYAEYVNGCVHCWRNELEREENIKLFPNRHVGLVPAEPQLHHILRAIEKKIREIRYDMFEVFSDGQMSYTKGTYDGEGDEHFHYRWNLSTGLYSQPTNVLDFLESLLVTK